MLLCRPALFAADDSIFYAHLLSLMCAHTAISVPCLIWRAHLSQVPGSHRWPQERQPKLEAGPGCECAHAVMPKGSCVIYLGSTLHSGGQNQSTQGIHRWGLNVDYNVSFLRQEVNQ